MLGLDRGAARAAWTVLAIAIFVAAIYVVRHTILIFTVAVFFAYMLAPIVRWVERYTHRRYSREIALTIVYVALVAGMIAALISLGSRVAEEAASLATGLPERLKQQDPFAQIPIPSILDPYRDRIILALREWIQGLDQYVLPLLTRAGTTLAAGLGELLNIILIPVLSFLFLKDGAMIRDSIVALLPAGRPRELLGSIMGDLDEVIARYIRALVILSLVTFGVYFVYFQLTGVPYALMLSSVAALVEFIPVIGPLVGSVVVLLVAGFNGYPHLIWILMFFLVYRLLQDYGLQPYLMRQGVELHPLLVLFGVMAGQQIGGIPGMFLSVPVMAALRAVFIRAVRKVRES